MRRAVLAIWIWIATCLPALATDVIRVTSPGGVEAWLVQEPGIPMLALNLHFAGGPLLDPPDKAGAARLMAGMIEEGVGDLDAVGFATRKQELAARLSFFAGGSGLTASAVMLTEFRDETIDLFALALQDPALAQSALDLVRPQLISAIRQGDTDPGALARRAFNADAFAGHPYSRTTAGTVETVEALTRDDILAAYRRSVVRDRITVSAVGDISAQDLGAIIDRLVGPLPEANAELPGVAEIPDAGDLTVIPLDSPQSLAILGQAGIARDDPDFLAGFVANQIFGGGGITSRLTRELRHERGLTYGVSSGLSPNRFGPTLSASFTSANESMGAALDLVRAEWARMAETGVTAEELAAAKRFLTGSYPLRFDSNRSIAGILSSLQRADLPLTYIDERNDLIEALTLEEVNAAAARIFRPEALRIVVVGQPEGLETTD